MGSGFKDFASGAILTAGDVDNYLMRQSVMTFASASARDTALSAVLDEGMVAYLEDTDAVTVYDGSAWNAIGGGGGGGKILQVVSTTKTDTFSTASSSFVDITGLSVSITPTSALSKILVMAHITAGVNANSGYNLLLRDSTIILQGDAASSRPRMSVAVTNTGLYEMQTTPVVFLDSPNTTSSTTYKIQGRSNAGATYYVNRGDGDRDTAAYDGRGTSTITVMEVSS